MGKINLSQATTRVFMEAATHHQKVVVWYIYVGRRRKKVNGGVHAYFLSVCPACCACALRANVTTCREDRHPPVLVSLWIRYGLGLPERDLGVTVQLCYW